MKHATPDEYFALVIASLVLIIVLIAAFMCLQLYLLCKPQPPCGTSNSNGGASGKGAEGFLGTLYYSPACGSEWLGRRRSDCKGLTTGVMPSIETTSNFGSGLCSGRFGTIP